MSDFHLFLLVVVLFILFSIAAVNTPKEFPAKCKRYLMRNKFQILQVTFSLMAFTVLGGAVPFLIEARQIESFEKHIANKSEVIPVEPVAVELKTERAAPDVIVEDKAPKVEFTEVIEAKEVIEFKEAPKPSRQVAQVAEDDCAWVKSTLSKYFQSHNRQDLTGMSAFYADTLEQAYVSKNISSEKLIQELNSYLDGYEKFYSEIDWESFAITTHPFGCQVEFEQKLVQKKRGAFEERVSYLVSTFKFNKENKIFYFRDKFNKKYEQVR
jgi:hypothetical protein